MHCVRRLKSHAATIANYYQYDFMFIHGNLLECIIEHLFGTYYPFILRSQCGLCISYKRCLSLGQCTYTHMHWQYCQRDFHFNVLSRHCFIYVLLYMQITTSQSFIVMPSVVRLFQFSRSQNDTQQQVSYPSTSDNSSISCRAVRHNTVKIGHPFPFTPFPCSTSHQLLEMCFIQFIILSIWYPHNELALCSF